MTELKTLLVDELQDLLNAENQIVGALPKMVEAAHDAKLKEAFQKHLEQTQGQVERLKSALSLLGEDANSKPCKGMKGLLEEGEETIKNGQDLDELTADLALIGAAQKVEHYEISGYGTARCIARQIGEREVAVLLSQTLGEEESADYILTAITKPLLQQLTSVEFGNGTKIPWGEPGETSASVSSSSSSPSHNPSGPVMGENKSRTAAASAASTTKTSTLKAKKAKA
jgi:ferritin-like metal-binding protein YciE